MNIDLTALPDDVETLQALVRCLAAERTSLTEARAEIERLQADSEVDEFTIDRLKSESIYED